MLHQDLQPHLGFSTGDTGLEAEQRYGPKLEQYLRAGYFDLSQREPPTYDEAFEAIESLREDLDVTYKDFETILSMEKSPACVNLYLLLSTPEDEFIGIFPACVNLLRMYCNAEGHGILDHAYGFLCLRVMSLVVQLAMSAFNNWKDSKWFEPFYLATAALSEGQSAHLTLYEHMQELLDWSKGLNPKDRDLTLFGVCYNAENRRVVCLPPTGECSIPDAEFLVEKLWSARDKFLLAARWDTHLFPGLGVMLHMICALFAAPHLKSSIPMSTWTLSDDDPTWVHFLELVTRYSLCCKESEVNRMAAMLNKFPEAARAAFERKSGVYAVNELDATQVAVDVSNKLKAPSDAPMFLILHEFLYGCAITTSSVAESLGCAIFDAFFDKIWIELCRHKEPTGDQLYRLLHSCNSMTHGYVLITLKHQDKAKFFLDYLSEKVIEVHARMILLPLLTQTLRRTISSMDIYEDQFRTWTTQLTMGLISSRTKVPEKLTAALFPTWYKIFEHLQFYAYVIDNPEQKMEREYFRGWVCSWVSLGLMYEMGEILLGDPPLCSYLRCPTPPVMIGWKCEGCDDRRYCTRRCQIA
ncbi:unnamed protein product [Rhizoctonia solani]|uniref:MYND-type domain-containing protein n=1 Tax=Rhizoctonia solani TaxID=456999 RepID=A0A8H3DR90_9AGAM|nr:unnamed protein product [Rhizoctonia solani]